MKRMIGSQLFLALVLIAGSLFPALAASPFDEDASIHIEGVPSSDGSGPATKIDKIIDEDMHPTLSQVTEKYPPQESSRFHSMEDVREMIKSSKVSDLMGHQYWMETAIPLAKTRADYLLLSQTCALSNYQSGEQRDLDKLVLLTSKTPEEIAEAMKLFADHDSGPVPVLSK